MTQDRTDRPLRDGLSSKLVQGRRLSCGPWWQATLERPRRKVRLTVCFGYALLEPALERSRDIYQTAQTEPVSGEPSHLNRHSLATSYFVRMGVPLRTGLTAHSSGMMQAESMNAVAAKLGTGKGSVYRVLAAEKPAA